MDRDYILVKKAKRGDVDAFSKLYEQCYEKLYKYALYTLKNPEDAEDVVSDTVTDAFASISKLKKEESFSSWIMMILVNKCKHKMRDYYQKNVELEEIEERLETSDYELQISQEEKMDVQEAFSKLDEEERQIVGMHVFFGYKTREIASILDKNENTVRSKESRALKKLESWLNGRGDTYVG